MRWITILTLLLSFSAVCQHRWPNHPLDQPYLNNNRGVEAVVTGALIYSYPKRHIPRYANLHFGMGIALDAESARRLGQERHAVIWLAIIETEARAQFFIEPEEWRAFKDRNRACHLFDPNAVLSLRDIRRRSDGQLYAEVKRVMTVDLEIDCE